MSEAEAIAGLSVSEALSDPRVRDLDLWARPVSWRGSGNALSIDRRSGKIVFTPCFGVVFWHPSLKDLISEWEIVEPDLVIDERDVGG